MTKPPPRNDSLLPWIRANWGVLAFVGSVLYQILAGSVWINDRTVNERALEARIVRLESSYVSQETFRLTMQNIEFRLTNLDANVAKLGH